MSGDTNSVHDNDGDSDDMSLGYGSGGDEEYVQEMAEPEPEAPAEVEEETQEESAAGSSSNAGGSSGPPPKKKPRPSENPAHKHHCEWGSLEAEPVQRHRDIFASPTGPTGLSVVAASGIRAAAVDFFREFFPRAMSNLIVHRSNSYVKKILEGGKPATFRGPKWPPKWAVEWKTLTAKEFDVWVALTFVIGATHKGPLKDFWSKNRLCNRGNITKMMSRDRYLHIRRGLHCQDDDEDLGQGSKLRKIGLLLDMLWDRCAEVYIIDEDASIDEQMLKFKGAFKGKFLKQSKPIREGLKFYAICEAKTGYTVHAILDGRGSASLTIHDFVVRLAGHKSIRGKNRTAYMDNLFTSIATFRALREMKVFACGTIRANRGLPAALEKKQAQINVPGASLVVQGKVGEDDVYTGAIWFDSGKCAALSTKHDGLPSVTTRKAKSEADRVPRPCPDLFHLYNQYMGGVDLADQKRAAYTCRQRTHKWWHCVLWYILDTAMLNASIVYESKYHTKWTGRKFLLEVAEGLLENSVEEQRGGDGGAGTQTFELFRVSHQGNLPPGRRSGRHYMFNDAKAKTRHPCANCQWNFGNVSASKSKCKTGCRACGVHLHLECFESWHEDEKPVSGCMEAVS